jgi:hypothetical protein
MIRRLKLLVIWLSICSLVGAVFSYFSGKSFWIGVILAGFALLLNGWLADREDHGNFND